MASASYGQGAQEGSHPVPFERVPESPPALPPPHPVHRHAPHPRELSLEPRSFNRNRLRDPAEAGSSFERQLEGPAPPRLEVNEKQTERRQNTREKRNKKDPQPPLLKKTN